MIVCPHCRYENFFNYDVCEKCDMPLTETTSPAVNDEPPEINTYLAEAILTTIFCFFPVGIVSVIYAAKAKSRKEAGDMQGVIKYSDKAKKWYFANLGVSFGLLIIYILVKMNF